MTEMVSVDFLVVPTIRFQLMFVFSENHLRQILRGYFDYYHEDRTHLSLDKETPSERPVSNRASPEAKLIELPRVGGLHHRCEWSEAA
jgi:hypothetical protein